MCTRRWQIQGTCWPLYVSDISKFEQTLLKEIDPEILKTIREEKTISESLNNKKNNNNNNYTANFLATV